MSGRIVMRRADELRPGDVFSTDGGIVQAVTLLQGGGPADEVAVWVAAHGVDKYAYLEPSHMCPLWVADVLREAPR